MRVLVVFACAALAFSGAADAALTHSYDFTTDLSDSVAGGAALQPSDRGSATGTVSAGFYNFQQGAGLTLGTQLPGATYTIDFETTFTNVDGYRKLISFNDLTSDNGLYIDSGVLSLYGATAGSSAVVAANTPFDVRLTRDGATGQIVGYINGVQQLTYTDTNNLFTAASNLWFLRDDTDQNREDSAGSANYIRIFDDANGTIITSPAPVGSVPEPASWAMFIGGFGLVGGAMRRRRVNVSFA